ncbi:biotin transporter BioY [bacterium]|nr:biotin transporter BioY [bacterium]
MQVLTQIRSRKLTGYQALIASLIGAGLTALCAKIIFYLPISPVPFTGQVFAVILCGMVLGGRLGALSQIEYIAIGLMGAPVFCGSVSGPTVLTGPTVGYLVGFVGAAYMVGRLMETRENASLKFAFAAGLIGVGVIHTCGVCWLAVWPGHPFAGLSAWLVGAVPFIGVDAAKAAIAAGLCTRKHN